MSFTSSLGPVTAVIGAQWGDEGKGKIVDLLSEQYDVIARACGGANAGHTIVVNGKKHVFHLLPSGCLHDGKVIVLGAGMVIHLPTLLEEIETLKQAGIDVLPRLHIATNAHILFEYHKEIDGFLEEERSAKKGQGIGTTKRGIGPAYMDKAARNGLRMELLKESESTIREELGSRIALVETRYGLTCDTEKEVSNVMTAKKLLEKNLISLTPFLHDLLSKKKTFLIEGAQATLLDLDHGTYPFVTSSFTTIAGALQGLGLPPQILTSCIGVAKAYCTRVGSGEFATEIEGETGDRLRERGGEYGSTTGRPRRCGWLDIADLKLGQQINGFTHWNITKLDVLDEEDVIPVGLGKDASGKQQYKEMSGWKTSTSGLTQFSDLPEQAQSLIEFIESETGIPASFIGTGQGREAMIIQL